MRQRRWFGRVLVTVLAIGVLAGPAFADLKVTGDQTAWADLKAAWMKLYALSGYRAKVVTQNGSQVVMEFVPPNSMHTTAQMTNGTVEMVRVGQQTAMKMSIPGAPAGWKCQAIPPQPAAVPNVQTLEGSVDVSRGTDTTINGTPVHTYIYSMTSATTNTTSKGTWYVGSQTGLPVRFLIGGSAGNQTTMDFYDYGAAITIAMPSCG